MDADSRVFSDVVCSFCGRRNREVRVVRNDAGLILCQVCVAKAAQIFDDEVGVGDPKDWLGRWPLKQGSAGLAAVARPTGPRAVPFDVVIHSDWSTAPNKRWSAEARFVDDRWVASAPRLVPDPLALIAPGNSKLLGFDFPIGLPIAYASQAGIDDFRSFLPEFGQGEWESFYLPATTPDEISLRRPFYPRRPGGTKQQHLIEALGVSSMNDLRRRCDCRHDGRGPAEAMFWTLGAKQVGRAAIAGWSELLMPARDRIRLWPFEGALGDLCAPSVVVVCETYPAEFYGHLGLPRTKTAAARASAAPALMSGAARIGVSLDEETVEDVHRGFDSDDAYDAFVGLLGMLNVVQGLRAEAPLLDEEVRRVEGWMLGQA